MFVAGRTAGELGGELGNDPLYCNLHHLTVWNVEHQASATMIGLAEEAAALRRWGIYFHLPWHPGTARDIDFFELLDFLNRQRDRIWVAPVAEVAAHITGRTEPDLEPLESNVLAAIKAKIWRETVLNT